MRTPRQLEEFAEALLSSTVREAVVRDGWPAPMVEDGFDLHRTTWRGSHAAIHDELNAIDPDERRELVRAQPDRTVAHIWPALPGAGVAPVLHGFSLGVGRQWIKPSSRGQHFARAAVAAWQGVAAGEPVRLCSDEWADADHVIVSGSDATVEAVVNRVGPVNVVGYGHRVSGALIVDDGDAERWAPGLATDIVMWHQLGCFSARGVIFVGSPERGSVFGAALAAAIADAEAALDATDLDDATASQRMQRLGRAEFETSIWRARVGWVERRETWDGDWISRHAVSLVVADDVPDGFGRLQVAPVHLQGIALGASGPVRGDLTREILGAGATRVCTPGTLQAPEPDWQHDGFSNIRAVTGPGVGRVGDNVDAQQTPDRVG